MYTTVKAKDKIRVPPHLFRLKLEDAIKQIIIEEYEGELTKDAGILLLLKEVITVDEGIILPEDGAVYYDTTFEMIAWEPQMHEVCEGLVTEVREFGVFMRLGPIDGLVHVSQTMDDFVSYSKAGNLVGRESGKTIKAGDIVKARIIAISLKMKESAKIGLTMRQPGLGKAEWNEKVEKKNGGKKK